MATKKKYRTIFCCGCGDDVQARLTNGAEVYPHRRDLASLPFWICDDCGNYVGCHHKTRNRTRPVGNIPTAQLREARRHIHAILDPLWKSGSMSRGDVYQAISDRLGHPYHTAELTTVEDAREVWKIVREISRFEKRGNDDGAL